MYIQILAFFVSSDIIYDVNRNEGAVMRDKFWALYTELKHKQLYYSFYQQSSKFLNGIISGICLVASCGSIAAWEFWDKHPAIWAAIIAIAQLIQAIKPLLPFSQQIVALKFLNPELSKLMIEIDRSWDDVNRMVTNAADEYEYISNLVMKFDSSFDSLTSQFIGDTYFPKRKRCEKKAEAECRTFFKHRYNVGE